MRTKACSYVQSRKYITAFSVLKNASLCAEMASSSQKWRREGEREKAESRRRESAAFWRKPCSAQILPKSDQHPPNTFNDRASVTRATVVAAIHAVDSVCGLEDRQQVRTQHVC